MSAAQDAFEVSKKRALIIEARISEANTRDDALERSIAAAEAYLQALKLSAHDEEKGRLRHKCKALLEQSELLKRSEQWKPTQHNCKVGLSAKASAEFERASSNPPQSTRHLSKREQIILLEGSKLNEFIFPPWKSPPDPSEFELKDGQQKFIDTPELVLSTLQHSSFDVWRRPDEILKSRSTPDAVGLIHEEPANVSTKLVDLVQDITTDCSVIASLCSITARGERGHSDIISSIFYPYDKHKLRPGVSANGKYVFRLHFNGCYRKIVIDDRLPASRTSRSLHVVDRNDADLLWPALLEKAYLKIRGGYDFPGSNSGTDLWVLTGWIPEQVFLQSDDLIPGQFWRRIWNAFNYGDVLVTLGTGKLTVKEEELGLASEHDYAVLDMKESAESRLLLVKNPWSEGTVWNGGSQGTTQLEAAGGSSSIQPVALDRGHKRLTAESLTPGTFWIDFNSVLQNFDSAYLNWNPCLFSYRQDAHCTWDLASVGRLAGCFGSNPQYAVGSRSGGVVWILLSRHFKTGEERPRTEENVQRAIHSGFISLYAFNRGGKRVFNSDGALHRGPYVDSPQTLLCLDIPPKTTFTVVVSEQSLRAVKSNFTISAFSRKPISLETARERYPHSSFHSAAWTPSTAGGNASAATYPTNPQFSLQLSGHSDITLFLEAASEDISVHVQLVWGNGRRVTSVTARDIVGESGDYRRGCALAEMHSVEAGTYSIVCSTFEPGQFEKFTLRVGATVDFVVRPIPLEQSGRLSINMPRTRFPAGVERVLAPLLPERLMKLRAIARYCSTGSANVRTTPASPITLSLELGQGPNKQILVVSGNGEFSDAPMGVRVTDVDWLPEMQRQGGLWIVLERLGGLVSTREELVEVELLSEGYIQFGEWGVGND